MHALLILGAMLLAPRTTSAFPVSEPSTENGNGNNGNNGENKPFSCYKVDNHSPSANRNGWKHIISETQECRHGATSCMFWQGLGKGAFFAGSQSNTEWVSRGYCANPSGDGMAAPTCARVKQYLLETGHILDTWKCRTCSTSLCNSPDEVARALDPKDEGRRGVVVAVIVVGAFGLLHCLNIYIWVVRQDWSPKEMDDDEANASPAFDGGHFEKLLQKKTRETKAAHGGRGSVFANDMHHDHGRHQHHHHDHPEEGAGSAGGSISSRGADTDGDEGSETSINWRRRGSATSTLAVRRPKSLASGAADDGGPSRPRDSGRTIMSTIGAPIHAF